MLVDSTQSLPVCIQILGNFSIPPLLPPLFPSDRSPKKDKEEVLTSSRVSQNANQRERRANIETTEEGKRRCQDGRGEKGEKGES